MYKVYVNGPAHFFFYNVKMTADYSNFPIQVVIVDEAMAADKDFQAKKSTGQFPFLETPTGEFVRESTAIAAFIARTAGNQDVLGNGAFEEAQVEQWVDFASATIAPNMKRCAMHTYGWKVDKNGYTDGVKNLKEACKVLNTRLAGKNWLVGDRLTLADIVTFNALIFPFSFVLDGGFRKAMPAVAAWFEKMSKLPVVARTAGYVKMVGAGPAKAAGAAAPAKKEKGGKAKNAKKDAPAPKKEEAKPAAAEEDEFDPFADDDEDDQDARMALKAKAIGKKEKPLPIAKSIILLEVKVWEADTDLDKLGDMVKGIKMDGLEWKEQIRKEPVAFGVFKLIVGCVVEDLKVSVDDLTEKITDFEDLVQSVDILSFNKL